MVEERDTMCLINEAELDKLLYALGWIANVNAMDYEYQTVARRTLESWENYENRV